MNAKVSKYTSFSLVSKNELPIHCPPKDGPKWNMHPKIFLPFDKEGKASCAYCGAIYKLEK